jgi:hypothetical protein
MLEFKYFNDENLKWNLTCQFQLSDIYNLFTDKGLVVFVSYQLCGSASYISFLFRSVTKRKIVCAHASTVKSRGASSVFILNYVNVRWIFAFTP